MGDKLYKYAGPDVISKAFAVEGKCSFKCSYPKDFNDPYELFLTIDYDQPPDALAYYREAIGDIPQCATTCFSKSPEVIPMWAHYAHTHRGVVIEVDEEKLAKNFPEGSFGDIDYRDTPDSGLLAQLYRAQGMCKPRHVYFLQRGVFSAAYYTKATCWSYEQERRFIVPSKDTKELKGIVLVEFPVECVTALIVGHRATSQTRSDIKELADSIGCDYYEMQIGRSSPKPFYINAAGVLVTFENGQLEEGAKGCADCSEPISANREKCPWCSIEDAHKEWAAEHNPMRFLAHVGLLEKYYESVESIRKRHKG